MRAVWGDITARGEAAVVIPPSPLFFVERCRGELRFMSLLCPQSVQ